MPLIRKIEIRLRMLVILIMVFIFYRQIMSTKSNQHCINFIFLERFGCSTLPEKYKALADYQYDSINFKTINNPKTINEEIAGYLNNSVSNKAIKIKLMDSRFKQFINTLYIFLKHNIHALYFRNDYLYYFRDTIPIDYEGTIHFNDSIYEIQNSQFNIK
jgi:hypothetical protein